ncbi:MAG: hypothetical protein HY860_02210 [Chlamydiales bacterium]|nr:hypothetical protein [Chlamydiales bacterium]
MQWFPYLTQLPTDEEKNQFLNQVVDKYISRLGIDPNGNAPFKVRRLNAVARSI